MNNPFGTRLIECFDRIAEQSVGIFDVSCQDSFHDIFATIPHEGSPRTIPFAGGNILAESLFGTGNVRHNALVGIFQYDSRQILPYFLQKTRGQSRRRQRNLLWVHSNLVGIFQAIFPWCESRAAQSAVILFVLGIRRHASVCLSRLPTKFWQRVRRTLPRAGLMTTRRGPLEVLGEWFSPGCGK